MLTIISRSIIIYALVLVVFRLMGKRQIGQMQPFELVMTLIIADLATIPMAEMNVPLLHGIVPLLTLVVVHYFLIAITKCSTKINAFVSGKPIIIIDENGINYTAVKKLNISVDDLFESLREAGYFSFEQILFAIMETNGKMSVLPKASASPVSQDAMKIKTKENSLPVALVSDGKLLLDNLPSAKISKQQVLDFIKKQKINIKNILLLTSDKNGQVYLQQKNKKYTVLTNSWTNEAKE